MRGKVEYLVVSQTDPYYREAVELRYRIFFKPSNASMEAVYDSIENKSYHVVAVRDKKVIGYIRLTNEGNKGRISQFVVDEGERGVALIGKKLIDFVEAKAKEEKLEYLFGEIRLKVTKAAQLYGFTVEDEIIYSKKTGIPHKRIEKDIRTK